MDSGAYSGAGVQRQPSDGGNAAYDVRLKVVV